MNIKEIEKFYENKEYQKVYDLLLDGIRESKNRHLTHLFIRSANKLSKSVKGVINEDEMKGDTDYLYNVFLQSDDGFDEKNDERLLLSIFSNDRTDIIEEYILEYLEKMKKYPIERSLFEYIIVNRNKPTVKSYIKNVGYDAKDNLYKIIKASIEDQDPVKFVKNLESEDKLPIAAYDALLKDKPISADIFIKFMNSLTYKRGRFLIFENEIYMIEKFEFISKSFSIKDKLGRKREINFDTLIEKTSTIEGDDFRVYKFFKPESAYDIEPCRLIEMILKYKNCALDKGQLKDELVYIFGKDASTYLTKNKKIIESCESIEIIYEKPERYLLVGEDGNKIFNKVKRLRTISQIKDYVMQVQKSRVLDEDDISNICEYVSGIKDQSKNEVLYLLTKDKKYIVSCDLKLMSTFTYGEYLTEVLIKSADEDGLNEEKIKMLEKTTPSDIEHFYKAAGQERKEDLLSFVQKGFRLGKHMKLVEWYITNHLDDKLIPMDKDYIVLRTITLASDIYAARKSDDYLNFIRRYLFDPKRETFSKIIKESGFESGKRVYDEFMKVLFLNDYQKDEIRRQIYAIFPEFRDIKSNEFIYSTKEGVMKKKDEFEEIVNKKLPQLSKTIHEAAELGDLSENSEYKFAREQYRLLSIKAEEIKKSISNSQPIDFSSLTGDKVEPGVIVVLLDVTDNTKKTLTILGPFDIDIDNDIISYKSPLAQKLAGKSAGEITENYKIIKITKYKEV